MKFKMQIANFLMQNDDIILALDIKDDEEIMYKYIFPYIYYPTQEIVRCMIGFELDTPGIDRNNEYFKHSELFFRVLCHQDGMITNWGGTRVDVLDGIITHELNWEIDFGLELKLQSSQCRIINEKYYAREIKFKNLKFNSLDCDGSKNGVHKA